MVAAAKDAGFLDLARNLPTQAAPIRARHRASRDLLKEDARFCLEWSARHPAILEGYGYN